MVLKLDPRFPVLWRDPTSLQVGLAPPIARLEQVSLRQERMLSALVTGVSEAGLTMLAGGDAAMAEAFLRELRPALESSIATPALPPVAVCGTGATAEAIARDLAGHGIRTLVSGSIGSITDGAVGVAIVVGHFVLPPEAHSAWLRRDVPHLPVVLDEAGVVVGPVVLPGRGPCLRCLELHRRDSDAAWPALAAQLFGRTAATESELLASEAGAYAVRLALETLTGREAAESLRIDAATGVREPRSHQAHPECGCLSLPVSAVRRVSAVPPESGSARVVQLASGRRSRPTTGAASSARA